MKFKIVLVEDEPTAQRHLRSIIEKKCPGFEVVGIAENGNEGLQKVEELRPDLLISDIRMPGMDGIELIGRVKKIFPEIISVIVSGYQEFEYAKKAIRSEVADYILKPISIPILVNLLNDIYAKLVRREYREVRKKLVQSLSERHPTNDGVTKNFVMALIRCNGPKPHFSGFSGNIPSDLINSILTSVLSDEEQMQLWLVQGQDENEWCLLGDADSVHYSRFREIVDNYSKNLPECHYFTAILSINSRGTGLFSRLMMLYRHLQNHLIPGKSQILYDDSTFPDSCTEHQSLDSTFYKKLDYVCTNDVVNILEDELSVAFRLWKKNELSAQFILSELRHVIVQILQYIPDKNNLEQNLETKLDNMIMRCRGYEDLEIQFFEILESLQIHLKCQTMKTGSRESLERITEYISSHIAEELRIPLLSLKFSISQSYLNRIFHKYTGKSVVEYIRDIRIEKSVEIMKNSPDIPIKEISAMIGYEDASYFSKVFKKKKGISPQHFRDTFLIRQGADFSILL